MQKGLPWVFLAAAALVLALVLLADLALETTAPSPAVATANSRAPVQRAALTPGVRGPDLTQPAPPSVFDELLRRILDLARTPGAVPDELLLSFAKPADLEAFRARAARAGIELLPSDPRLLTARVRVGDGRALASELAGGGFDRVGPNYLAWVPALPRLPETDADNAGGARPFGSSGREAIGAGRDRSDWGRGITVAVLDTGVTEHPQLEQVRLSRTDLVQDGQPVDGHGTAMASLIAGADPAEGGVAPAVSLLDIRVADAKGESTTALVAQGILTAVDQGARVINISLGTNADAPVLRRAVEYALERGVVIVAAAGNDQATALAYPAGYAGVVSVAAVDANGVQAFFSNSGTGLVVAAPGVGIVSAYRDNQRVISSGTSQAAALTSGVVATMLGWGYSGQSILKSLTANAKPTGAPAEQTGAGLVQVPRR
jgi:thermitase